jgi:hypothetical protein
MIGNISNDKSHKSEYGGVDEIRNINRKEHNSEHNRDIRTSEWWKWTELTEDGLSKINEVERNDMTESWRNKTNMTGFDGTWWDLTERDGIWRRRIWNVLEESREIWIHDTCHGCGFFWGCDLPTRTRTTYPWLWPTWVCKPVTIPRSTLELSSNLRHHIEALQCTDWFHSRNATVCPSRSGSRNSGNPGMPYHIGNTIRYTARGIFGHKLRSEQSWVARTAVWWTSGTSLADLGHSPG